MSHHRVQAEQLSYTYADNTQALDNVSFEIVHGESVALVGPNGAGKSTLMLQLCGVLLPTQGRVIVGDVPVTTKTLDTIRRTVGMVFQDPDDQLFMPTVEEDIAFGPLNLGLSEADARQRVEEALTTVGALHLKHRPPYRLSAGEKRAAAIASILSMTPDILVMDEPSSNLDPKARRQLITLLQSFKHTKIIATHDLEMAVEVCPRTILLHDGKVVMDGPTRDVFRDTAFLEEHHLEKPLNLPK
jgi:cobalt/nickel transport system ATP-binding protein